MHLSLASLREWGGGGSMLGNWGLCGDFAKYAYPCDGEYEGLLIYQEKCGNELPSYVSLYVGTCVSQFLRFFHQIRCLNL